MRKSLWPINAMLALFITLGVPPFVHGNEPRDPPANPKADGTVEKKHGYASVNGLKMYYEIHGKGEPLVLLHGGGSTIDTTFGKVLPSLAKTRQVIAFEQQGHGRTADIADRPFTFEQSTDDTAGLLAAPQDPWERRLRSVTRQSRSCAARTTAPSSSSWATPTAGDEENATICSKGQVGRRTP